MPHKKNPDGKAPVEKKPLLKATRQCDTCGGHKYVNGKKCGACNGQGWVSVQ